MRFKCVFHSKNAFKTHLDAFKTHLETYLLLNFPTKKTGVET